MEAVAQFVLTHPTPFVVAAMLFTALWLALRPIANDRVGVVERLWSVKGSLTDGLIALDGQAGFVPEVRRGGIHFFVPFQFRVHVAPLVTIPQGRLGYVFARDGRPLDPTQTLACNAEADDFVDVRAFLERGGQRGPQRRVLREGTWPINLAQFIVITDTLIYALRMSDDERAMFARTAELIRERGGFEPVVITDDVVGVVTVHDGPGLEPGDLVAPVVSDDRGGHNNFQDVERFLALNGRRGRQLQVLVEGTYAINRLFATIDRIPKTVIDVGSVGVVVSYTGAAGADVSGDGYKHGELVAVGQRGVWDVPMKPGKYAFNTFAGKIVDVPTTNFILKWDRDDSGIHRFDENLAEISLITKDAFEPLLPLSVVVHIDYRTAPLVIQRFGDVKRLVEQTLDPMVSAYFKNVAQTRTLIQLIHDRSNIQQIACEEMKERFARYNLELLEVLIGTPTSAANDTRIEDILAQLRSRQIACEQLETYARQQDAAVKERELREAEARASRQHQITESELAIAIQGNQGRARCESAVQKAQEIKVLTEARAARRCSLSEARAQEMRVLSAAKAEEVRAIGLAHADEMRALGAAHAEEVEHMGAAQAHAIEQSVAAYGDARLQLTRDVMHRFSEAVERAGIDIVPRVMVGGDGGGGGPQIVEGLVAMLLGERSMAERVAGERPVAERPLVAVGNGKHSRAGESQG